MPTYYKPTERRRKRVVYKSIDPAEPGRDRRRVSIAFGVVTLFVLVATAIVLWMK